MNVRGLNPIVTMSGEREDVSRIVPVSSGGVQPLVAGMFPILAIPLYLAVMRPSMRGAIHALFDDVVHHLGCHQSAVGSIDDELVTLTRYMHLHPVRAGLVPHPNLPPPGGKENKRDIHFEKSPSYCFSSLACRAAFTARHSGSRMLKQTESRYRPSRMIMWQRRMPSSFAPIRRRAARERSFNTSVTNCTRMHPHASKA